MSKSLEIEIAGTQMTQISRRGFTFAGLSAAALLPACGNGIGGRGPDIIDARVSQTMSQMYQSFPETVALARKAQGILVIPLVTEAGFGLGGAYGRGALRINDVNVDYYSVAKASTGLQIGAAQYAHVLFFMTETALMNFRHSAGWAAGADIEYVVSNAGETFATETTTALASVIGIVFGQAGLRLGATLEGTKYTRIVP